MQDRLKGKAIIVAGADSGSGAEGARRLSSEGARLCVADCDQEGVERIAHEIKKSGGNDFAPQVDIADEASVTAAVAAAEPWFLRVSALRSLASQARPAYAASKVGLEALMRHVASRWGRKGITAICVAPGLVTTPGVHASGHVPQDYLDENLAKVANRRLGRVEVLVGVAALLLSKDGGWINSQVFHINGGATMR